MHMAAQEVLHGLIEEELQVQRPRVGQRDHKAGQRPAGAADRDMAKVGPIGLRLIGGKGVQAQERLAHGRPQPGHRAPQLHDAAGVAALVDHLVNARGAQPGMLV